MGEFTYNYIRDNILNKPNSGCIEENVQEIFDRYHSNPPWSNFNWAKIQCKFKRISINHKNMSKEYIDGYEINTIVLDTNIYMDYIMNEFKQLGGNLIQKNVNNIEEVLNSEFDTIINCSGLGSRDLFNDKKIFPVRGQSVIIKKIPEIKSAIVDHANPIKDLCIITPRINDIVIGGVNQAYNWNLNVEQKDTEKIIAKCQEINPKLKDIKIINITVGLRPQRYKIRIEKEIIANKTIIHNYGHGESGFTLSWGCAQKV